MKIIEAMKRIKDLQIKAEDIRGKIRDTCAHLSFETPVYQNPGEQVSQWLQAHSDILKEILRLRVAIQKTNIQTDVTIEIDGKNVTKTIAEWIHRRRDLADLESAAYKNLTDRNLKEGKLKQSTGEEFDVKIIRNYEPKLRDKMIDIYRSEPSVIDSTLEVKNAVTDIVE